MSNNSGASHIYADRRWIIARRAALARADFKCEIKLPGCTGKATQGDHIIELEDGGEPFALTNVQAACRSCNVAKGNTARDRRLPNIPAGTRSGLLGWSRDWSGEGDWHPNETAATRHAKNRAAHQTNRR